MLDISNLSEKELLDLKTQIQTKLNSLSADRADKSHADYETLSKYVHQFNQLCRIRHIDMRMDLLQNKDDNRALLRLVEASDDTFLNIHFTDLDNVRSLIDIVNRHTQYTSLYHMLEDLDDFRILEFDLDRIDIEFRYKNITFAISDMTKQITINSRINLGNGTANYDFILGDFTLDVFNPDSANLEFELNHRTVIHDISVIESEINEICDKMFDKIESLRYYAK